MAPGADRPDADGTGSPGGGQRGGGTRLTPLGEEVVRRYRASERLAEDAAAAELRALMGLLR